MIELIFNWVIYILGIGFLLMIIIFGLAEFYRFIYGSLAWILSRFVMRETFVLKALSYGFRDSVKKKNTTHIERSICYLQRKLEEIECKN